MNFTKVLFGFTKNSRIPFAVKSFSAYLNRHCKVKYFSVMPNAEDPPKDLKGIKVLDKNLFKKKLNVCCLTVEKKTFPNILVVIKPFLLKIPNINSVTDVNENTKKCLLNPNLIESWSSFNNDDKTKLEKFGIAENNFKIELIELNYDNYSAYSILKTILPEEGAFSFSIIGHILHLNLSENLNEYKKVIAEIYFDKISNIKTVVYKTDIISNTFRFFEMEVLIGENNFIATVKENSCFFKLDFSKVFWNPRLSTEHDRIGKMVKARDVMFDVFAGIGPFAILAAKKKCYVFANDLNPESVNWLNYNITLNKCDTDYIKVFNKDGGDFILSEGKSNLIKTWEDKYFNGKIYFVMNLPAIALTFLKYFKGLITKSEVNHIDLNVIKQNLPIVHCYFFAYKRNDLLELIESQSNIKMSDIEHSISIVRSVATCKVMYRLTFELPLNYLLKENTDGNLEITDLESDEPLAKKSCMTK